MMIITLINEWTHIFLPNKIYMVETQTEQEEQEA
jgi:hypothetical protein